MSRSAQTNTLTLATAPDVLTVEEAAQLLRLGKNGCYEAIRTKQLPAIKIGKRLLVAKTTIMRMLNPEQKGETCEGQFHKE